VTGGAMGIGEAAAPKLAAEGAAVAVLDTNREAGERTAAEIANRGAACDFFAGDLSHASETSRAIDAVVAKFGPIDVLVSNAGIQDYGDVLTTTEQAWDRRMGVNLKGCFLIAKFAVPHTLKRGNAAIVVVGSAQSMTAVGNSVAYLTAKHGLLGRPVPWRSTSRRKALASIVFAPVRLILPCCAGPRAWIPIRKESFALAPACTAMGRIGRSDEVADAICLPRLAFVLVHYRRHSGCGWRHACTNRRDGFPGGRYGGSDQGMIFSISSRRNLDRLPD